MGVIRDEESPSIVKLLEIIKYLKLEVANIKENNEHMQKVCVEKERLIKNLVE